MFLLSLTYRLIYSCCVQVPVADLKHASEMLIKALLIREKYMAMSLQTFPKTTARFLHTLEEKGQLRGVLADMEYEDLKTIEGLYMAICFLDLPGSLHSVVCRL